MKATGIVRRIDDLGRIVIPKEIRRTLRIKEGDPLEIFTDREGEVILKKYSQVGELGKFAAEFAESLAQTSGHGVTLRAFPERITEPIASPPQRIGVITCGTSGLLSPLVSST